MIGNELQNDTHAVTCNSFVYYYKKKKYLYLSDHAVWSTQSMTLPGILALQFSVGGHDLEVEGETLTEEALRPLLLSRKT